MPAPNYVWWIEELMRSPLPTGDVIAHRLYKDGPFDTAEDAGDMIELPTRISMKLNSPHYAP